MKLKVITIGLALLTGAAIGLKSIFSNPVDEYNALLLENIEALAQEENDSQMIECYDIGTVNCPQKDVKVLHVEYFSLRDKVSLY